MDPGLAGADRLREVANRRLRHTDEKKHTRVHFFGTFFFVKIFKIHEIEIVDPRKWYHSIRLDESFQNLVHEPKNLNPFKIYDMFKIYYTLISALRYPRSAKFESH